MYYVIFSKDSYLLARMATDLQMEGFVNDEVWNADYHPFAEEEDDRGKYLAVNHYQEVTDNILTFFADNPGGSPIRLWITEKNYTKVLTEILNNKK